MEMSGFKIGSIRGIPIRIHFTFLIVLPLLAFLFSRVFQDAARLAEVPPAELGNPLLWGLGIALALFLSVLLHELAHSLYALRKGGKVRDITLMMVGGVSQITEMPRESKHEAVMAFAGPALSIGLGIALYGLHLALAATPSFQLRFALFYLGALNLFLGVFNLLPAFPMDGGRILRALLVKRKGMVRATEISSRIGKVFAIVFGIWGLISFNVLLMLIAVFVYAGADAERRSVLMRELIGDARVRDLMTPHAASVPAETTVYEAAEIMVRERRVALTVTRDGQVHGLITLDGIQKVPSDRRLETQVGDVATAAPTASPDDLVTSALQKMNESGVPQLAVTFNGNVIGSIGRDEIVRGVSLRELQSTQRDPYADDATAFAQRGRSPRGTFGRQDGNGRTDLRR